MTALLLGVLLLAPLAAALACRLLARPAIRDAVHVAGCLVTSVAGLLLAGAVFAGYPIPEVGDVLLVDPLSAYMVALVVMVGVGFYFTQDAILGLFASDPKPVVTEVKNEEAPPAEPAPAVMPPVAAAPSCPKVEGAVPEVRVFEPVKVGNFVFVQAKVKQTVCVADGSGKTNMQVLEAGSNFNFIGNAPFTVSSEDLSQIAIFYQGKSVRTEKAQVAVKLVETKLVALASPAN